MISQLTNKSHFFKNQTGNALVAGIAVLTILSIFGVVMSGRMIIDAHAASKRMVTTKAFYLADGGIQYARRYLHNGNSGATTLGPVNIGDETVTVEIARVQIYYGGGWESRDVYRITSTATVGLATRSIVEMRDRGPVMARKSS